MRSVGRQPEEEKVKLDGRKKRRVYLRLLCTKSNESRGLKHSQPEPTPNSPFKLLNSTVKDLITPFSLPFLEHIRELNGNVVTLSRKMHALLCPKCGAVPTESQSEEALDLNVASGTRHHTLLNSNEPPDDSESSFIRSVISRTDARVAHLDEKIAKLWAQLEHLEKDRASLSSYRARNSAILSPLRRMPPEILSEIFLWTLPSINDVLGKLGTAASPWMLPQISSRWRAIALTTAPLWSLIAVDYSQSQGADAWSAYPLAFAEAQIERSQKLKIHFYAHPGADDYPQIRLFQFLARHSSRWEELSIGVTAAIGPLLPALRDRLPSLKRSWIQWQDAESQTFESVDSFQTAPSLVDAAACSEFRFVSTAFPVQQLTRYHLDGPWAVHREMLKLASNLIEARIEIDFDDDIDDPWSRPAEIIDLHHIRRLYVSDVHVLRSLRVPVLEELAIWVPDDGVDPLPAELESLVTRSACPLRRLCLRGYPNADVTSKMLQKTLSITELAILAADADAEKDVNALMTTLTVPIVAGSTVIAPQLRFIAFGYEDDSRTDDTLFLGMVKSRWDAGDCTLKSAALLVESGHVPEPTILFGFRALRQEGLDLLLLLGGDNGDEITRLAYGTTWN
ncbi:hypothetical protein DFH06DRAFT_1128304 [Mycena polygramma]|nr:hypothetical protein DFH06DRAFT_1128304 [Mycena polygramma]